MNQPTVIPNQCILRIWNAILHYKKYSMQKLSSPCSTGDYRKMGQFPQISDYITLSPRPSRQALLRFVSKYQTHKVWRTFFKGSQEINDYSENVFIFDMPVTWYYYKFLLALRRSLGDGWQCPISCGEYTTLGLELKIFFHFHVTIEPKEAASTYREEMKCCRLPLQHTTTNVYAPINRTGFVISREGMNKQQAVRKLR